ncbi:MAG: tRNA preQ1(34) S-adenosylmethionine ribosyltransferase-isomerase QueA [Dehalococcoidia bacterium]
MRTDDFDFALPRTCIAQTPVEPRDSARLMVLRRAEERIEHRLFRDIGEYLRPGDLLVMNDTRVLRARLRGRLEGGGAAEALLLRPEGPNLWRALVRPGRRLRAGRTLAFGPENAPVVVEVAAVLEEGERLLRFPVGVDPDTLGETPLPPYIHAPLADSERYQTVYAREPGSAAAPTAGLHFTAGLLDRLRAAGVATATVTLHIGPGTFRPVSVDDPHDHPMHSEHYRITASAASAIATARGRGGRIVCVGTTAVRVVESVAETWASQGPGTAEGWTELLILPGHRFRLVDALITNFHLPRSTLLMLVSALAGREFILRAYREAVVAGYRFFSFGDAMLIL